MNTSLRTLAVVVALTGAALPCTAEVAAAPVEYVRVCSLYGAAFHYIPGTDICLNDRTGDARVQTEGGTWRSLLPYPEGKWVTTPLLECAPGRLVNVGTFASTDFTVNAWNRLQTASVPLTLRSGEFVSRVMMSGGFYDPRVPNRHGVNGTDGLCLRSVDPTVLEPIGGTSENPPFGNGMLPVGCIANSRIVNMPATYAISATSAHPSVDSFFVNGEQTQVAGPYTYGTRVVVTTDLGAAGPQALSYFDARTNAVKPMAGKLAVSVCVDQGTLPTGGNGR